MDPIFCNLDSKFPGFVNKGSCFKIALATFRIDKAADAFDIFRFEECYCQYET